MSTVLLENFTEFGQGDLNFSAVAEGAGHILRCGKAKNVDIF